MKRLKKRERERETNNPVGNQSIEYRYKWSVCRKVNAHNI